MISAAGIGHEMDGVEESQSFEMLELYWEVEEPTILLLIESEKRSGDEF